MNISFKEKIYSLTNQIPKGKVVTYGQLAKLAGKPKAARAVGLFMKTNPNAPHTPCHRVVAAGGNLTGYSGKGGIAGKKKMLLTEGVLFNGNKVDLSRSLWEF
ncbi:MGMT family protein [Candidatus Roizmanbacteria bacterium]|nr:MGMT family protein [Candidatus Roizmanbacteria bacterium]